MTDYSNLSVIVSNEHLRLTGSEDGEDDPAWRRGGAAGSHRSGDGSGTPGRYLSGNEADTEL